VVDPFVPRHCPGGERTVTDRQTAALRAFVKQAQSAQVSSGHHNLNYVVPLSEDVAGLVGREPGTPVTVRIRRADALPVVIRTWEDEAAILKAVGSVLSDAPECLAWRPGFALHSYVEGVPLSSVCGNGKPVDTLLVKALVELPARMTQVRRGALPPLPAHWPGNPTGRSSAVCSRRSGSPRTPCSHWPSGSPRWPGGRTACSTRTCTGTT
jgi:hypothetical protein